MTTLFFSLPIAYYRHDYWPLNCKQYKPNRQKSHRFSLASESLVPVYGMNKFYTKNQSTLTLFNQAPPVGKPYTNSVPLTMQSQVSKSRNVTLYFKTGDALKVSGHALFTSKPYVFLLNIFLNKTKSIHFYWIHFLNKILTWLMREYMYLWYRLLEINVGTRDSTADEMLTQKMALKIHS